MTCPVCGGTMNLLGRLGSLDHLRCRHCGIDQSLPVDPLFDGGRWWGEESEGRVTALPS